MRVSRTIIGALLLVVPFLFLYSNGIEPIRLAKMAGVSIIGSIALGLIVSRSINTALGACVAWCGITMGLTGMGAAQENLFVGVVTTLLACSFAIGSTQRLRRLFLIMFVVSAYLQAAYGLIQMAGLDGIFIYFEGKEIVPVGFMGQQTVLGPYVAAGIVGALAIGGSLRLLIPIMAACLVLCNSSFTYLSLGAGLAVFYFDFLRRGWLWCVLMLASAVLFSSIFLRDQVHTLLMDNGRFLMWQETVALYADKFSPFQKLVGVGGGGFAAIFPKMQGDFLTRMSGYFLEAHNDYLQVLFEFGAIGFLLMINFLVECYRAIVRAYGRSSIDRGWACVLVCILANSLGNFPMRLQPHGGLALLAFILIATTGRQPIYLWKENPHGSR